MIDFEKFTNYSQEIIFSANAKKDFYKNTEIQPEHIVMAMIEDKGIAKDYLEKLKLLNQHFINEIVARIKSFPTVSTVSGNQQIFLSKDTNTLLEIATQEANALKDEFIGIECIFIAMTKLENSFIQNLLKNQGISTNSILNVMKEIRGNKKVDTKNAEESFKKALQYDPDLIQAKYNLALIYESNNRDKAKELYIEVLEQDPGFEEAKNALSDLASSDY